jgi:hypothetical protein
MVVREKLRKYSVQSLENSNIYHFGSYSENNGAFFNKIVSKGVIDYYSIENALRESILDFGKRDFEMILNHRSKGNVLEADHVLTPQCLAYSLNAGEISEKEEKNIYFEVDKDHFLNNYYDKKLPSGLRKMLLNPPKRLKYNSNLGPEDCDHCVGH